MQVLAYIENGELERPYLPNLDLAFSQLLKIGGQNGSYGSSLPQIHEKI